MSVLFCDTDCELWHTAVEELGVQVIKMPYIIDGEEYLYDLGEETDFIDFFDKMKKGSKVMTAGLNESAYIEYFEPYFKKGEDILYIAFSSKMSSTFIHMDHAISVLHEKYPNVKFRRFDTLNISLGAGVLVYLGAKFFNAHNCDIDKTYEYLEKIRDKVSILFVVDDLIYLSRGGRISKAKATIANVMHIKPILTVNKDGEIDIETKVNGSKKAYRYILNKVLETYINIDGAPIYIVDADNAEIGNALENDINENIKGVSIVRQPIGPVIGAHCGPGTYGIIFMHK